jgi:competence protein ComEC
VRVVGLGDLEIPGQEHLESVLSGQADLMGERPVDVVKVAHHGSAKQDGDLYRRLAPALALIGVGAGNDYGHPAPSTLTLLAAQRIPVYRTDRQGTVEVSFGADDALRVTTSR